MILKCKGNEKTHQTQLTPFQSAIPQEVIFIKTQLVYKHASIVIAVCLKHGMNIIVF